MGRDGTDRVRRFSSLAGRDGLPWLDLTRESPRKKKVWESDSICFSSRGLEVRYPHGMRTKLLGFILSLTVSPLAKNWGLFDREPHHMFGGKSTIRELPLPPEEQGGLEIEHRSRRFEEDVLL